MTGNASVDAIREYLHGRCRLREKEISTETDFDVQLSGIDDLRELRNVWRRNFASSYQRRQLIEARMREVISKINAGNQPDWFWDFLYHTDWILDGIDEVFSQKVLEILEQHKEAQHANQKPVEVLA